MTTKEELTVTVGMLHTEMQTREAKHSQPALLVENEVFKWQVNIKDKKRRTKDVTCSR